MVWIAFTRLEPKASKLDLHKKVCGNTDFYGIVIPSEDTKSLLISEGERDEKRYGTVYAPLLYERFFNWDGVTN